MKAVVIHEAGGPEKLIYEDVPTPEVRPGWSLVRVMGFGINHSEIFTRNGLSPSVSFPRILGIECVGVIAESTDPGRLPEGQKVISIMGEMGRAFDGSYAEYTILPNEQIYPVETDLPWNVLASIPETYYTAYGSMLNLKIEPDDRVLVRGATSGVGVAFLRLIKARFPGIFAAGTTRSTGKAALLKEAGFDEVILDEDGVLAESGAADGAAEDGPGAAESGPAADREGFDKALELIGPATLRDTFRHMNEHGIVCSTGQLGGVWAVDGLDPIFDLPANGYLTSFYSGNVSGEKLQAMLDFIGKYHVDAGPEKVFGLDEVPDAHRYLDGSRSFGKVVVVNGPAASDPS